MDSTVYHKNVPFTIDEVESRSEPKKVMMCTPDYFDVVDVKNIHMNNQQGRIDKLLARNQWSALKSIYQDLVVKGMLEEIEIIPGAVGCEDMVFCANQSFPWMVNGEKNVVMSKMFHDSRKREVPYFEKFYKSLGYKILHLQHTSNFEGMGDTIPHPGKQLLYGGYGHRSSKNVYNEISQLLKVPVVALELKDSRFYHLDTCFVPLDSKTVMLCEEAFTMDGLNILKKLFENIIDISAEEANNFFSLNAHVISDIKKGSKAAILQKGSIKTVNTLQAGGFNIFEVDTSEYMKSGGSVFCMKMMYY